MLGIGILPAFAANEKVAYRPGLNLVPEVLLADGHTARLYTTSQGTSLWTHDLPILQGDQIKLDIFAATGGAELREIKVRLDNAKVADLQKAPWNVVIDTSRLTVGYHMIEAWGQSSGEKPQSSTSTLSFYVTAAMPVQYAVKGSQQVLQGGTIANVPLETQDGQAPASRDTLDPPEFLKDQMLDPAAQVVLHAMPASAEAALRSDDSALTISAPTVFYVSAQAGSAATHFAYALVRNGHRIIASPKPFLLEYQRIRIQSRTETSPGLRSGPLTLYIWGIDKDGHPAAPLTKTLIIP